MDAEHQILKAKFLASVQRTSIKANSNLRKTRLFMQTQDLDENEVLETPAKRGGTDEEEEDE